QGRYGSRGARGVMQRSGLARGGSLDTASVPGTSGALNGLRYDDEFVRHKILDLLGDLALLGRPIGAHVIARNGGHALNLELVLAIQRAVGLERRAAAVAPVAALAGASRDAARREGLVRAPGLAALYLSPATGLRRGRPRYNGPSAVCVPCGFPAISLRRRWRSPSPRPRAPSYASATSMCSSTTMR